MPLTRIYADRTLGPEVVERLSRSLPSIRDLLCRRLDVDTSIAHISIVEAIGAPGQVQLAVEIRILPKPGRSRDMLVATCEELRTVLETLTGARPTVRITTADPTTYLVLR